MIELGLTMFAFWATTVHSSCPHDLHCGLPTTMTGAPCHLGSSCRWDSRKCSNHGPISRLLTKFQVHQRHMDSLQSVSEGHELWSSVTSLSDPLGVLDPIDKDLSSQGIYIHRISKMRM
ncbi:hypothetical protein MKW94_027874 [Papaver nudicaule]|uniref:Uncharacterized protein n=1 Tax=Papaver nudicaule TaxID=74823 RepID=A0AA41RTJ4_PAPNU|nr:hypothetical protein [Papaver nudicaule]